jgi:hypothetical protein
LTRLNALDVKSAGSDAFGLTNYNKLKTDIEYLTVAGADLASAATINPTAEFHAVTGTTTIDNLTDTVGAVPGQQVTLWIKGGPLTIRNNGGGTGNVRTASGLDVLCATNDTISFVYDGTVWRQKLKVPRVLRGAVSAAGGVSAGSGFSASRSAVGTYSVTFTTAFAAAPIVVAVPNDVSGTTVACDVFSVVAGSFGVSVYATTPAARDTPFMFIATEV